MSESLCRPVTAGGLGASRCDLRAELVERFDRPRTDGWGASDEVRYNAMQFERVAAARQATIGIIR
eukprot:8960364-Pyramimonas_sp.AAC.1